MSTLPPALVISMAEGSGLAWQQRIGTPQALVRGYNLKRSAIQPLSKAQLRKAIFTKDYLKGKPCIHSSKHSTFYPWRKPEHLAATRRGHVTLPRTDPLSPDCILMPSRVLLSKRGDRTQTEKICYYSWEKAVTGTVLTQKKKKKSCVRNCRN